MPSALIQLRGVRVHNLKDVDLDLPREELIVICGVSGSGKTSLALDTLYAEGQRRFIETFPAYTRQFLERLEKPAADRIEGLPPAIAVTRRDPSRTGRTTIAGATETADYQRLLFAKLGRCVCTRCGAMVRSQSPESAAELVAADLAAGATPRRLIVGSPRRLGADETWAEVARGLREQGYVRAVLDDVMWRLEEPCPRPAARELLLVLDRLTADVEPQRLRESLEAAFDTGEGQCEVWLEARDDTTSSAPHSLVSVDGVPWRRRRFMARLACGGCGAEYPEPDPRLFYANSPLGACPRCEGAGEVAESAAPPAEQPTADEPTRARSPGGKAGGGARAGRGRETKVTQPCHSCGGSGLRPEALAFRVGGWTIVELGAIRIDEARRRFESLVLDEDEQRIGRLILDQIRSQLRYLDEVGLGYLELDRPLTTLSGGEAQRVALSSALGSGLVNMLYVLDEPTAGLHPRDVRRLVGAIEDLRRRRNTVVVVEHEEQLIEAADQVVEVGPGAGERGGHIVFQGTADELRGDAESLTGQYLAGRRGLSGGGRRRPTKQGRIRLTGARGHNLRELSVDFPLGVLCVVSGVSGAGKSSLVQETLYGAICRRKRKEAPGTLPYDDVVGDGQIDEVVLVDQAPIGRSPRSNPVTYVKAFDPIRAVFAETLDARVRNLTASHFSFNVDGGRCAECEGDGALRRDMQFLPDVFVTCPSCGGTRYRREILEVAYRGRNIADVLAMTVREAFLFFRGQPRVQGRLKQLIDVGLDYVRLGQPANTLSSGESQRVKLAAHLSGVGRTRTLFLLDEPTNGLHFADIVQLLDAFDSLLAVGHSLIVVEHNLQLMCAADYLIDLGPGAGDEGGRVVAQGTPEEVAKCEDSVTGRYLAAALARRQG